MLNVPPLILRLIKNIRKNLQDTQRQFQNRGLIWPIAADGESQFVDGEVDHFGCVVRVTRLLEDEEAAGWLGLGFGHCGDGDV
jgi:hypothetical protein